MSTFSQTGHNRPSKNKFDLSHERKFSMKMGDLVPMLVQEIMPGDSFRVNTEILMRLAPLESPVMHRINVYTHFFFVPNRINWNEWEEFITGGREGTSAPAFPSIQVNELTKDRFGPGSLADYFGLPSPSGTVTGIDINALPFKAYQDIYNEYYRDQNLTPEINIPHTGGIETDTVTIQTLAAMRKRAWEKDYFTSALPWPQRGDEISLPLGDSAPVVYADPINKTDLPSIKDSGTGANFAGTLDVSTGFLRTAGGGSLKYIDPNDSLEADLSSATAITINTLRMANQLQVWLEKSARAGSRYIEQIEVLFGVRSSDARLQRPEYLGGGKQPVVISEVLNSTTSDAAGAPEVGELYGHGISVGKSNNFTKTFEEHGFVIGIISVLPATTYQQGMEKIWTKFDKFDYPFPSFAHLGEQEIKDSEIFYNFGDVHIGQLTSTFGYQQRYAEYKYKESSVHGEFKTTLDYWHMSRIFSGPPALNTAFVEADPTKRIFTVTDPAVDELYVQLYHNISALRPLPYHSIPSL